MKNETRYNLKIVDTDKSDSVESTTPSAATTENAVDNDDALSVGKPSDRVKKLREGLAEDDDLDV